MAGTLVANVLNTDTGLFSTNNAYSGIAKAWAQFSVSGSTVTVNGNFNISSITRNSAGYFTVNFSTAMSNANYAVSTSSVIQAATYTGTCIPFTSGGGSVPTVAPTTSAFALACQTSAATNFDPSYASFVVFD